MNWALESVREEVFGKVWSRRVQHERAERDGQESCRMNMIGWVDELSVARKQYRACHELATLNIISNNDDNDNSNTRGKRAAGN